MEEFWDIYDENRNLTGRTISRAEFVPGSGDYHLVVHIWIKNSNNEWLISKRTPNKFCPLLWECTGGSVIYGESSIEGALREVKEELGIDLPISSGYLYKTIKRDVYSDFCDIYVFDYDCSVDDVILQEDETCDVMWASSEKISKLIETKEFIPLDNMKYVYSLIGIK